MSIRVQDHRIKVHGQVIKKQGTDPAHVAEKAIQGHEIEYTNQGLVKEIVATGLGHSTWNQDTDLGHMIGMSLRTPSHLIKNQSTGQDRDHGTQMSTDCLGHLIKIQGPVIEKQGEVPGHVTENIDQDQEIGLTEVEDTELDLVHQTALGIETIRGADGTTPDHLTETTMTEHEEDHVHEVAVESIAHFDLLLHHPSVAALRYRS